MIWDHSLIEIQFENLDSVILKGGKEAIFYDGKSSPLGNSSSFLEHGVLAIKPKGIKRKSMLNIRLLDYLRERRIVTDIVIRSKNSIFKMKEQDPICDYVIPMDDSPDLRDNKYQNFDENRTNRSTYFLEFLVPEETGSSSQK